MSNLILIRHAETDMAGTFCGHSDPPINDRGKLQVKRLLEAMSGKTFEAIYSSDLQRALDTSHALALAYSLPIMKVPALREIHFGDWEGLTWKQIEERDPAYSGRWTNNFPTLPAPGGESYAAFRESVLNEIDHLLLLSGARPVAVVTHAGVMRIVLQERMGYSAQGAWEKTKDYCCFFECLLSVETAEVIQQ